MPKDDIRVTATSKLHNRPACVGDARRAYRRGYVGTVIPVTRQHNTSSRYVTISEINNVNRASYIDVKDVWSQHLQMRIMDALLAEYVQVEVIPAVYPPGIADGTPYVWVYLGFAPDRHHPDVRNLGYSCGPDVLSALLRALSELPKREELKDMRCSYVAE